jgi:hypothetical protein
MDVLRWRLHGSGLMATELPGNFVSLRSPDIAGPTIR